MKRAQFKYHENIFSLLFHFSTFNKIQMDLASSYNNKKVTEEIQTTPQFLFRKVTYKESNSSNKRERETRIKNSSAVCNLIILIQLILPLDSVNKIKGISSYIRI